MSFKSLWGTISHFFGKRIKKTSYLVVSWEMSHNPVGRAFLFADFLRDSSSKTLLFGPFFKRYGKRIWKPLRKYPIRTETFNADVFPNFLVNCKSVVKELDHYDRVIICKPRIPSILIGLLYSKYRNIPFILDIDDHELSFFKNSEKLSLDDLWKLDHDALLEPYEQAWTQYAESLVEHFPVRVVSNDALKTKFGGTIIPHVRNQKIFDPKRYNRNKIRTKLGIKEENRVVLFLGTPRPHKGFLAIPEALNAIGNENYKFLLVGKIRGDEARKEFSLNGDAVMHVDADSSFKDLPKYLAAADLICLIQDESSPISQYQMPAKFTDALSMEVPVIGTNVPPLKNLADRGLIELLKEDESLADKIDNVFSNYPKYKSKAIKNRAHGFLRTHSYSSGKKTIETCFDDLRNPEFDQELTHFIRFLNNKFYKESRSSQLNSEKLNIVFFWKQNDSDIYGRRQDMLVKYLAKHPCINKIVHFDSPIKHSKLADKRRSASKNFSQDRLVYEHTKRRSTGVKGDKLVKYTFVYGNKFRNGRIGNSFVSKGPWRKNDYLMFIRQCLQKEGVAEENSIFWFCPAIRQFNDIMSLFNPGMIVSDFIDDQRQWHVGGDGYDRIENNYRDVLNLSDLVLCNSEHVQQFIHKMGFEAKIIHNGLEDFKSDNLSWDRPQLFRNQKRPVIGYVGNLDVTRLDIDLIRQMAIERPSWDFLIIGSIHKGNDALELEKIPNVRLLGVIPYDECLKYINCFSVGIIPHFDNEMSKSMNPLKAYVYRSLSIPVVTTPVRGLDLLGDGNIYVAKDAKEFVDTISNILNEQPSYQPIQREHTWEFKVQEIVELITDKIKSQAKVSD